MKTSRQLSSGRIRADQSKLVPTNSYSIPQHYEDIESRCRQCHKSFVFSKEEQQAWYEEYKIPHYATRRFCSDCAAKERADKRLCAEYDSAYALWKSNPENSTYSANFGRLAVLRQEFSDKAIKNRLQIAISALKSAIMRDSRDIESYYWLGRCYESLQLVNAGMAAFEAFVEKGSRRKGLKATLLKDARERIEALEALQRKT